MMSDKVGSGISQRIVLEKRVQGETHARFFCPIRDNRLRGQTTEYNAACPIYYDVDIGQKTVGGDEDAE